MNRSDFTDYEEVLVIQNVMDQAFLKSVLDAEGISYFIQGEHAAPYLYYSLPLRVMVKKEEAEKARRILRDIGL